MKKFDYQTLNNLTLTPRLVAKLSHIYELRGRLFAIPQSSPTTLTKLIEVAKVQSTDASNRIEGIFTTDTRLRELVSHKTTPHNRSEQEISGYRDVLDLIHNNYEYIPISADTILGLHKQLFNPGLFIEFQKSSAIPRFTRDCAALVFHPLGAPIC